LLSELETGKRVVGVKQSTKAIKDGVAAKVFLAEDAEDRVRAPFVEACGKGRIEIEMVPAMRELGAACGIDVGAAVAVLIK